MSIVMFALHGISSLGRYIPDVGGQLNQKMAMVFGRNSTNPNLQNIGNSQVVCKHLPIALPVQFS